MQGWRISMEDAHATILDLQPLEGNDELKPAASDVRISFFGVYDGHGGDKVALYTGEHLHKIIARQESFKNKNFEQALKDGFLAIDRAILSGMLWPACHRAHAWANFTSARLLTNIACRSQI
jgi:protein phosphatase 2C family protein 2/3